MFRFTMLFALVVSALVGLSMVPSAKADEAAKTTGVSVFNQSDFTVYASGGHDTISIGPHSIATLTVVLDEHGGGSVHADSLDGSKHWDETVSGVAVYLCP